ncbi:IPT/TIG domain-containing protein [Actinoplanes sp. NPDC051851]|uniref:IPT/TIG domain-containing protein n=1 Tax=Actinoplanes sp. NPDC051851 TaxID=3154753 RepID=UPI00342A2009
MQGFRTRAGLASVTATVLVMAGAAAPAAAAPLSMTLSSTNGPSGGGNSVIGTVTATANVSSPFAAGTTPTVQFQAGTSCGAMAKAVTQIAVSGTTTSAGVLTVDPDTVKRISTTKIAFVVPSSSYPATVDGSTSTVNTTGLVLMGTQTTAKWSVCVYDSASTTSSALIASTTYTIAVRPKITAILPASSPAAGGQSVTVNGVGFGTGTGTSATTANIGGVSLTGIKVASTGTSFTGVTGARAAGTGLVLTVNTPGGQVTSSDPDNNGLVQDSDDSTVDAPILFTYSNGITIQPSTGVSNTKVDIDVKGVGFSSLTFNSGDSGTPTDTKAHIFLVKDAYVAASNRGVAECKKILIISNNEVVCTLDLTANALNPSDSSAGSALVPDGTYTMTVVATGDSSATTDAVNATILSSGATFTVGPY